MKPHALTLFALMLVGQFCAGTAEAIEPYQAQTLQPYQAKTLQPDYAKPAQPSQGIQYRQGQGSQVYQAKTVRTLTAAERAEMRRHDMQGYHPGKRSRGQKGLTQAQIDAYGRLNHNIGVYYSGQDHKLEFGK